MLVAAEYVGVRWAPNEINRYNPHGCRSRVVAARFFRSKVGYKPSGGGGKRHELGTFDLPILPNRTLYQEA
ncbi:MAG: hypothetical protein ACF8CQ_15525 [Rhodopirellula sp. JB044]|uniref:hypothetical protein n=1 Tax=Rhodopirellula sp. JB044 TaxID=3342844 RepID=UPI00370B99EA